MAVLKEVIEDYHEKKDSVRVINHEMNKGLAAARNTALFNSLGEFVYCVDSDDWLEPDTVELLMSRQLEKDSDIVSGNYLIHNENADCLLVTRHYKDKEQMVLQMMQRTWDHFLAGKMIRRSLFIENGLRWNEGLDVAEDRYMMTLLAYHASAYDQVNSLVYHYERRNTRALTNTVDVQKVLRNQRQELGNVLLLEEFFRDKETDYQEACSHCVMEELERSLQTAIECRAKDEYNKVGSIVRGRSESEMQLIGWENHGLKGWIKQRYGYIILSRRIHKVIRSFKKRIRGLLGSSSRIVCL